MPGRQPGRVAAGFTGESMPVLLEGVERKRRPTRYAPARCREGETRPRGANPGLKTAAGLFRVLSLGRIQAYLYSDRHPGPALRAQIVLVS